MQEIFHVGPFLDDAANATDLSDLFDSDGVPKAAGNPLRGHLRDAVNPTATADSSRASSPADNHGTGPDQAKISNAT